MNDETSGFPESLPLPLLKTTVLVALRPPTARNGEGAGPYDELERLVCGVLTSLFHQDRPRRRRHRFLGRKARRRTSRRSEQRNSTKEAHRMISKGGRNHG